jgi:hypothetical protein
MAKKSGGYYISVAEKNGFRTEWGKGDHCKIYPPNGGRPMICPENLKGNGTEYAIRKFLIKFGVVLCIAWALSGLL